MNPSSDSNLLINAVSNNDAGLIVTLVGQGYQLSADQCIFLGQPLLPQTIDLLATLNALPDALTAGTLKYILFLMGNKLIKKTDFADDTTINYNGCNFLKTPIEIISIDSLVEEAKFIINKVTSRPLFSLFNAIEPGLFTSFIYYGGLEEYKKQITQILYYDEQRGHVLNKVQNSCEIAELFIKNPTAELYAEIEKHSQPNAVLRLQLAPFFANAGKNNKIDLFDFDAFIKLCEKIPELAKLSFTTAILFESWDYAKTISSHVAIDNILALQIINLLCSGAELSVIKQAVDLFQKLNISLVCQNETVLSPLYEAIVHADNNSAESLNIISYLIEQKIHSPNKLKDDEIDNYLYRSIRGGNIEVVKLLCANGFFAPTISETTPLHVALRYKQWQIAYVLVTEYGCDLSTVDYDQNTPLHFVADDELDAEGKNVRAKLLELSKPKRVAATMTLGFIGTPSSSAPMLIEIPHETQYRRLG